MKKFITLLSLTISIQAFAQPRPITVTDSVNIETTLRQAGDSLAQLLRKGESITSGLSEFSVQFTCDTFMIEQRQRFQLEIDYSTRGMIASAYEAQRNYDSLLNHYYELLMAKLSENDREILELSQQNWLKFRDTELTLNRSLTEEKYTGGGTIQAVIAASRALELTRNRLIDIYVYRERITQ